MKKLFGVMSAGGEPASNPQTTDHLEVYLAMLDSVPTNVMMCDPESLVITYANRASIETLKKLEHMSPVKAENLVGTCIDIFHKNPEHQRRILRDPKNLPFHSVIQLGDEYLDLQVTAIFGSDGHYIGPVMTWSIVTEKVKGDAEVDRLLTMIDNMPVNVMTCDPETFEINYINSTSIQTMTQIERYLPVKASELLGQSIDIFHKNPEHQRKLLSDPSKLPYKARVRLGSETFDLNVSAITSKEGKYIGPMVTWDRKTEQIERISRFGQRVADVAGAVISSADHIRDSSSNLVGVSEQRLLEANTVASASSQTTASVQAVAAATEELAGSIAEIGRQVSQSAQISQNAVTEARKTNTTVQGLVEASSKISAIVDLINNIAGQTNLLALNATIEAARAGDAGKGFAVVASEVKNLAKQTSGATDDITAQVASIQAASSDAVTAIEGICQTITKINDIATEIAASVEQQGTATNDISSNVHEAATGTEQVSETITGIADGLQSVGASSNDISESTVNLSRLATELTDEVNKILAEVN